MQVRGATERADLAVAEHPGDRHGGEGFAAEAHVAVGAAVEAAAAAEATRTRGEANLKTTELVTSIIRNTKKISISVIKI